MQKGSVLIAFLGSLLIIKPSFDFVDMIPALCGFMGGLFAGGAYTCVRALGLRQVKGASIVFFFSAFSCTMTLPFLILQYHDMSMIQLLYLLLAGLSAAGGQFAITAAYTYAPAKEISVYDYSQVVFSAIIGFFLFAQIPDLFSIVGYIIIILVAILMFQYQRKKTMS